MTSKSWGSWVRRMAILLLPVLAAAVTIRILAPEARVKAASVNWTLVWSDEFDGAFGSSPDPARWVTETGRPRLGQRELPELHGPARKRARRGREPRDRGAEGGLRRNTPTPPRGSRPRGPSTDLRQVRGPPEAAPGPGDLARVLDARQRHRGRGLAEQRRDRHHGARQPGSPHRGQPPRPGLQRGERAQWPVRGSRRLLLRQLPHLRGGVGAGRRLLVRRQQPLFGQVRPRRPAGRELGLQRSSVLRPPEPRGGRTVAGPSRQQHRLSPAVPRGLRPRVRGRRSARRPAAPDAAAARAVPWRPRGDPRPDPGRRLRLRRGGGRVPRQRRQQQRRRLPADGRASTSAAPGTWTGVPPSAGPARGNG